MRYSHNEMLLRPYLHMYSQSNEVDEIGIIALSAVHVENDPHKELLLGVSFFLRVAGSGLIQITVETLHIHSFHLFKFACSRSSESQGETFLGRQT